LNSEIAMSAITKRSDITVFLNAHVEQKSLMEQKSLNVTL
jgi:hypothetical protein